ncbi:ROK family protein [Candidatus Woesearchaeota archaeon]|nr:MAG: glucokinase [archaeon GW2011_AR4]MBS3129335.1 ROK family protein [Candidatus Woesearchaeota archaeon]HIH38638.1 ROK family protein [Candidatus Woesearchaeota archaeon]HIH49423.1 ROK family protein [Candidatus Woesearchaeota archaeon]HIJ02842.1 ROK family protein [Candidatus Woesearchaeota archaeon]
MGEYFAGVDVGGTATRVSIFDYGSMRIKVTAPTGKKGQNTALPEQVLGMIDYACHAISIPPDDIANVGISTCSPFRRNKDYRVVISPNLCDGLVLGKENAQNDWTEIPLEEYVSKRFRVEMGNDCVTAVVAEHMFGAGKGCDNLVYVTWSTGIGGGAYVDGHLLGGKNGNAPHLGHMYIAEDGPVCGCGNYGDLEALTSGTAIAREYRREQEFHNQGDGRDYSETCAEDAFREYDTNCMARSIINRAARNFARGLASINALLDTRRFIIGGSVFMKNRALLLPLVIEEFYQSFPALSGGVEIVPSALDQYLGDIAALSLVIPEDWVQDWEAREPWKLASESIPWKRG